MKKKRLLAIVLTIAMLAVSIPYTLLAAEGEAVEPLTSSDGNAITLTPTDEYSDYVFLNSSRQDTKDNVPVWVLSSRGNIRWDRPSTYATATSSNSNACTLATYGFTKYADNSTTQMRWAYIALKTTVENNGTYDISAKLNIDTATDFYTVSVLVDGMVHSVDCEKSGSVAEPATLSLSLDLIAGEHIIVFSYPFTTDHSLAKDAPQNSNNNELTWATNYHSITLDEHMSVLAAPTLDEVTASINNATRVEAEDSTYATLHGAYAGSTTTVLEDSASGKYVVSYKDTYTDVEDITIETLRTHLDKNSNLPYVEYKVTAPSDGTYNLRVGAYFELTSGETDVMPKAVILANDRVYESTYNNSWGDYNNAYFVVELKKGENIIRTIGMTADMIPDFEGSYFVNQDYIEFDNKLTIVPVAEGNTLSTNNKEYVTSAKDNTSYKDYLYFSMADMRWDGLASSDYYKDNDNKAPAADSISLDYILESGRIPHIKFSVFAEHDGYYDISLDMYVNATAGVDTLVMFVDEQRHIKTFTQHVAEGTGYPVNTIVDVSTYLEKGEHTIVISTPMPLDQSEFSSVGNGYTSSGSDNAKAAYPHACMHELKFSSGITAKPLSTSLGKYESEDALWNGYYMSSNTDTTVGNVNWDKQTATFEDIVTEGLDVTKTSFIQYNVTAPADGRYFLEMVGTYGETSTTTESTPFLVAVVNGVVQKLEINSLGTVVLPFSVELKKGENAIYITSPTKETIYADSVWFNQDYLSIDPLLDFASINRIDAIDSNYVAVNKYTAGTSYVGSASLDTLKEKQYTLETIKNNVLLDVPYIAVKVQVESDGYYDFNLHINPVDYPKISQQIAVFVDGQTLSAKFMATRGGMLAKLYLTEGEHVIIFTSPIPESDSHFINTNNAYYDGTGTLSGNRTWPWLNYYSIGAYGVTFLEAPIYSEIIPATGDINGDGVVNANDKVTLRKYLVGAQAATAGSSDVNADTNEDVRDLVALIKYIDNDGIIYVSDNGTDENNGLSETTAVKTMEQAIRMVPNNGIIAIADTLTINSLPETSYSKTVTVTSGSIVVSSATEITLNDNMTFENLTFTSSASSMTIYANGYDLKMSNDVNVPSITNVYGGTNGSDYVGDTSVTLLSGTYNKVYAGSNSATITGNTNLVVGGTTSVAIAMGGSNEGDVTKSTTVTIQDSAKITDRIYGVSDTACEVATANINVTGGTVKLIYGGGKANSTVDNVNVCISGSSNITGNIYGGGHTGSTVNNTSVIIKDNAVCGANVYGGGYQSVVNNNTSVTIQDEATCVEVYGGGKFVGSDVKGTATVNIAGGYISGSVRGGAEGGDNPSTHSGSTVVNVTGGRIRYHVYGAGYKSVVQGTSTVNMSDGTIGLKKDGSTESGGGYIYGGSDMGTVTNTVVNFSGGTVEGIIGGSGKASVGTADAPATVVVNVTGGTVNRRIIGGCYNDWELGWETECYVTGTITVTISENASIVTSTDYSDYGITAASRIGTNYDAEIACIKFTSEEAKTKFVGKLGLKNLFGPSYADADDDGVYEIVTE